MKQQGWYLSLLNALRQKGHSSLADEIEGVRREEMREGAGGNGPDDGGTKRTKMYRSANNPHDLRKSNIGK